MRRTAGGADPESGPVSYAYASRSLLEQPQNYMYTPFEGAVLLDEYFEQRSRVLQRLATDGDAGGCADPGLFEQADVWLRRRLDLRAPETEEANNSSVAEMLPSLTEMSLDRVVRTETLLRALVSVQLSGSRQANVKTWLDRVVQRFEVTKKLYESYAPGFRKGHGAWTPVRPYCLLALTLCLYYADTRQVKYLSTWLKVSDLLSTLRPEVVREVVPPAAIELLFTAEVACVRALAENKGVAYAAR